MKFTTPFLLALAAVVNSASLQKRDLSTFVDSINNVTAQFVTADNAIVGVVTQLDTTRALLQSGAQAFSKETVLSDADTVKMLNEFAKLKEQITTTMDHFGSRRAVLLQSAECKDISDKLFFVWYWGFLFSGMIKEKSDPKLQWIATAQGDAVKKLLKDQVDAFKCT